MPGLFDYTPAPKARRLAVLSSLGMALLCVISLMDIKLGAAALTFLMVPTFAIYLWPRGANPVLSLLGITLVGFGFDHLSHGPLGLWPLTWLTLFLIYRPDTRPKDDSFLGQWVGALLVLICVLAFQLLLASAILSDPVYTESLLLSAAAAFFVFPLVYLMRENLARAFGIRDDFFYERPSG